MIASGRTTKGEYYLADAVQLLIERGQRPSRPMPVPVWEDCGKPEELLQTNRYLLGKRAAEGELAPRAFADSVVIQPSSINPTAVIHRSVVGPTFTSARARRSMGW